VIVLGVPNLLGVPDGVGVGGGGVGGGGVGGGGVGGGGVGGGGVGGGGVGLDAEVLTKTAGFALAFRSVTSITSIRFLASG
jgi:hypothetical protein